ncbi:hypothetical protein [uncultured Prevotella sp.]|uniref:hypothetical protein n=1 Tax=uncultured Prevotella sp. TaxID=159272 RepID=UPI0027E3AD9C|nr:hypothetical protein [uncultured Prevotella sp.]
MKKIVYLFLVFITIGVVSSCNSKSAKEAELRKQMVADSIYNDSISKEEKAAELKDKKIEFLKNFYKNTIYSSDEFGSESYSAYTANFERHLSPKVKKALADYDDGIDYGQGERGEYIKWFVLGDEGDYGDEGPKMDYEAEADNWFKVTISDKTTVRIKVDSDPEDDENFIVTGLECPNYGIKVTP